MFEGHQASLGSCVKISRLCATVEQPDVLQTYFKWTPWKPQPATRQIRIPIP